MKSFNLRCIDVQSGPGQLAIRVCCDGDTLTIESGLPDPWRPHQRLTIPSALTHDLCSALTRLVDTEGSGHDVNGLSRPTSTADPSTACMVERAQAGE